MLKFMRTRLVALFAVLLMVAVLAGCATKEPAKPAAAPAPVAATPAPAPAPVDKGAIIKEAAVSYFASLPPTSNMVEGADLKKKVDAKDAGLYMIDIRAAADFALGHVPGAVNIPMATMGTKIDSLPKDKQLVLMCYSGQTSGQTIAVLKMVGLNAVSLKGGYPTWEKVGGTVAK